LPKGFYGKKYGEVGYICKKLPNDFDTRNYLFKPQIVFAQYDYPHKLETYKDACEFGDIIRERYPELLIK